MRYEHPIIYIVGSIIFAFLFYFFTKFIQLLSTRVTIRVLKIMRYVFIIFAWGLFLGSVWINIQGHVIRNLNFATVLVLIAIFGSFAHIIKIEIKKDNS